MSAAAPQEPQAWSSRHWWSVIALAVAAHFALVFIFGAKNGRPVRPVARVPFLQLARPNDELIGLEDPTLFALPHPHDFAAATVTTWPLMAPAPLRWTTPPHWLALSSTNVGQSLRQFLNTNQNIPWELNFQPEPQFNQTAISSPGTHTQTSSFRLRGELTRRALLTPLVLRNWPNADVIAPSKVQVLVNASGKVISAVLLPADYGFESANRDDAADQEALNLARAARFSPARELTVGQIIFNWHAVPLAVGETNLPPAQP